MGIVVIGATMVDIKGYPDCQYIPGGRNAGKIVQVHGGVSRNIAEDIANVELKPTFVTALDNGPLSTDVLNKLKRHHVNTDYTVICENGLGTWLAVFDNDGDVTAAISSRPDLSGIGDLLDEKGDEIISKADSVTVEIDMDSSIVKKILKLAEKHKKKVFAVVSNMSIAIERRDLVQKTDCFVCNDDEAGLFFSDNYSDKTPEELAEIISTKIKAAKIRRMVVTMGGKGAVYAEESGNYGVCPPVPVAVIDTTGAGDAFFSGVTIGMTYGKSLADSCRIGARLASSVISNKENVCPRFLPEEFGLTV